MSAFLNFHSLAAPRGDGLRPELRALLERLSAVPQPDLVKIELDRHLTDVMTRLASRQPSDEDSATPKTRFPGDTYIA
jgi:hypothetical protein